MIHNAGLSILFMLKEEIVKCDDFCKIFFEGL